MDNNDALLQEIHKLKQEKAQYLLRVVKLENTIASMSNTISSVEVYLPNNHFGNKLRRILKNAKALS